MLKESKLIAIAGLMNVGKDTLANFIQAKRPRQLRRYAFARPIKEACKAMFGWTDFELEDRVAKETVDPFWGFSPRHAMRMIGTDFGRNMMRKDIWLKAAEKYHSLSIQMNQGTIITDLRFENEADWIRSNNGTIVHVFDPNTRVRTVDHESEIGIQVKEGDLTIINDKEKGLIELNIRLDHIWTTDYAKAIQ